MFDYIVTGSKGYIGSRLADMLLEKQKKIKVLDNNYFEDCSFNINSISDNITPIKKDIRDIEVEDFDNVKIVLHLAALSNDPIGNLNSTWTDEINNNATVRMAKMAKKAGVERFIFSSSCIMYGNAKTDEVKYSMLPLSIIILVEDPCGRFSWKVMGSLKSNQKIK